MSGAVASFAARAIGRDEQIGAILEFAAEVATVELLAEDGLGKRLQLAEGEALGQELEAERGCLVEAAAKVREGLLQQLGVIECQPGQRDVGGDIEPAGGHGIALGGELMAVAGDESNVKDGDHVPARVSSRCTDGGDLFEED